MCFLINWFIAGKKNPAQRRDKQTALLHQLDLEGLECRGGPTKSEISAIPPVNDLSKYRQVFFAISGYSN